MKPDQPPNARGPREGERDDTSAWIYDRRTVGTMVPASPVRAARTLGITEDLAREPDGVPHYIVGLTAMASVILAMLVAFMILAGRPATQLGAGVLLVLAIPAVVYSLRGKSNRGRDAVHPSR